MAHEDHAMGSLIPGPNYLGPVPIPIPGPTPGPIPGPNQNFVFPSPIPNRDNTPEWIALLQTMINHMANKAPALAPHSLQNMVKFSDPPRFLGKSRDVDAYVKTIQSRIDNARDVFPNDSLKTFIFQVVAWSWSSGDMVSQYMQITARINK